MNWIKRYIAQIKWYLPRSNRNDIADELNSLLHDKAAEREEELDRPLDENETLAMLKEHGHPLVVASSYTNGGPLVSEALLPLYWLVVRYMVGILLAVYTAAVIWYYGPGDRSSWPGITLNDLFHIGMVYFAGITLAFHFAGQYIARKDFFGNWNPAKLPREDAQREPLFSTVIAVTLMLVWLRLLSFIPVDHSIAVLIGQEGSWVATFVLWLKLQVLLYLPVYLWFLYQPYWSVLRRGIIMLANLCVVAGGLIVLFINPEPAVIVSDVTLEEWEAHLGPIGTLIISVWTTIHFASLAYQGFKLWKQSLSEE